jgi:ribosomal protein L7/L12
MDKTFLYAGIAIMLIVILRDYVKKKYNFDMDNVDIVKYKKLLKSKLQYVNKKFATKRTSGTKSLVLTDAGSNKATVMATLRQITGMDYSVAKNIVDSTPSEIISGATDKELNLTKKALEFVGATLEIREN